MGDGIGKEDIRQAVEEMACEKRSEDCLKRHIFECSNEINELVTKYGFSRTSVYDRFKEKFGASFPISAATFFRYLRCAKKKHDGLAGLEDMPPGHDRSGELSQPQSFAAEDDISDAERVLTSDELKERYNKYNRELDEKYERYVESLENKG